MKSETKLNYTIKGNKGSEMMEMFYILNGVYAILFFFLIFYLFIHETPRERQRHRQREKQATPMEPDAGLDPGSWYHNRGQKQTPNL